MVKKLPFSLFYYRIDAMRKFISLAISIILTACLASCEKIPAKTVCFKNTCVQAEIADTHPNRTKGLMFRKSLGSKKGMLFIFEQECIPSFYMKNVSFPLDMIWFSGDKKVVHIVESAPPCRVNCAIYTPDANAKYTLEVNAGFVKKYDVKIGDSVDFK